MATTRDSRLPYDILQVIRRYRTELRADIEKAAIERRSETGCELKPEEIAQLAYDVIFGDGIYDEATEAVSLEEVKNGKFVYLEDWIDELQAEESAS
jgi:hypothetical protein